MAVDPVSFASSWLVLITYEQFRYAFANAVSEDEEKELYQRVRRAGAGCALSVRHG